MANSQDSLVVPSQLPALCRLCEPIEQISPLHELSYQHRLGVLHTHSQEAHNVLCSQLLHDCHLHHQNHLTSAASAACLKWTVSTTSTAGSLGSLHFCQLHKHMRVCLTERSEDFGWQMALRCMTADVGADGRAAAASIRCNWKAKQCIPESSGNLPRAESQPLPCHLHLQHSLVNPADFQGSFLCRLLYQLYLDQSNHSREIEHLFAGQLCGTSGTFLWPH